MERERKNGEKVKEKAKVFTHNSVIRCNLPHRGEGVKAKIEKWRTRARIARTREGEWFVHPAPLSFRSTRTRTSTASHADGLQPALQKSSPVPTEGKTIGHDIFFS